MMENAEGEGRRRAERGRRVAGSGGAQYLCPLSYPNYQPNDTLVGIIRSVEQQGREWKAILSKDDGVCGGVVKMSNDGVALCEEIVRLVVLDGTELHRIFLWQ